MNMGPGGKRFKLDGFVPKEKSGLDKDLALEFLGCAFHGIKDIKFSYYKFYRT